MHKNNKEIYIRNCIYINVEYNYFSEEILRVFRVSIDLSSAGKLVKYSNVPAANAIKL